MRKQHTLCSIPAVLLALLASATVARQASAAGPPVPSDAKVEATITPPRLSYTDGEVSFWRPGAEDWTPSQLNTALAAGDRLYTGPNANLELELAGQAYVRAGEQTQLGIANLEPDFIQVEVMAGHAALDVRSLPAGHTIEIDTPNAAFTIDATGYYRVSVDDEQTTFITRRGGHAKVTPAGGKAAAIAASEQVVVHGRETPTVETYVAPDLDPWDRWNYARTDRLMDSLSARYVPPGVAGTSDLDYYGKWRVVPTYGPVWVPTTVAAGWVPYSNGRWVWDPYYGWTWVDYAPWGWAPYHYGRWVYLSGYWAWAPGPLVVRAVYAPALVAFYGGSNFSISIGIGGAYIGWAPLGWGEPCWPWWGPSHFRRYPWWGGWGGPRHHDHHDRRYRGDHDGHHRPVVVEREGEFGRGHPGSRRVTAFGDKPVEPLRGQPPARATRASLAPGSGSGRRPPDSGERRPLVATRRPHDPTGPLRRAGIDVPSGGAVPRTEVVKPPKLDQAPTAAVPRPPFGSRGGAEREPLPPPAGPHRGVSGGKAGGEPGVGTDTTQQGRRGRAGAAPEGGTTGGRGGQAAEPSGRGQAQDGGGRAGRASAPAPPAPPRAWRGGGRPTTVSPGQSTPKRAEAPAPAPPVSAPRTPQARIAPSAPRQGKSPQSAPRAAPAPERAPSGSPLVSPSRGYGQQPKGRGDQGAPAPGAERGPARGGGLQGAPPQAGPSPGAGGRGGAAQGAGSRLPGQPANQVFRGWGQPQQGKGPGSGQGSGQGRR